MYVYFFFECVLFVLFFGSIDLFLPVLNVVVGDKNDDATTLSIQGLHCLWLSASF